MDAEGPQDMKNDDELCSGVNWSPIWVKRLVTEHQWAERLQRRQLAEELPTSRQKKSGRCAASSAEVLQGWQAARLQALERRAEARRQWSPQQVFRSSGRSQFRKAVPRPRRCARHGVTPG